MTRDGEQILYITNLLQTIFSLTQMGLTISPIGEMVLEMGRDQRRETTHPIGDSLINLAQGFQVTFTAPVASCVNEVGESFDLS